jgi:hypothetical protein
VIESVQENIEMHKGGINCARWLNTFEIVAALQNGSVVVFNNTLMQQKIVYTCPYNPINDIVLGSLQNVLIAHESG